MWYHRWLADAVVAVHAAYVACVVFGLFLFLLGRALGWRWVHNRWVRGTHLAMILLVVVRTLVWEECPLTWWEYDLRAAAAEASGAPPGEFQGSAVGHVLHLSIHPPSVPLWVFPIVYAIFAALVVATLWFVPVHWRRRREGAIGDPPCTVSASPPSL